MIENEILLNKKVKEPRYSNYFTWFRYYQELNKELEYPKLFEEFKNGVGSRVCFSNLFRELERGTEDKIESHQRESSILVDKLSFGKNETILIGIRLDDFKDTQSNYCLISPEYIKPWCETFKTCIDYNVDIILDNPENPTSCLVRLDIPSLTKFGNLERLLLTWVRYLYENPYNYGTVDALRLKQMEEYKDYSLYDLYGVVSHCLSGSWGTGHSVVKGGGIFPKEYMLEYFNSTTRKLVNDFGINFRYSGSQCRGVITIGDMYGLLDVEKFKNERLEVYKKTIEAFEESFNRRHNSKDKKE